MNEFIEDAIQATPPWLIHNWPWLVGAGAVVLILMIIRAVWASDTAARRRRQLEDRVGEIEADPLPGMFGGLTPALAAQIPESEKESGDFAVMLRRAGLYSPSAKANVYAWRFLLLAIPIIATGLFTILLPSQYTIRVLVAGGLAAAALSIIPRLYVFARQKRRIREIRHGLADMMDMLSMCLSGGLPILPSLEHVARNLANFPALSNELRILRRQAEVGNLQHALVDFGSRVDVPEVRQLTNMLTRGDQLGTQLSNSLHEQADHFRATRKQLATMQANKAPVKLTIPLLFCFAPAALILLMSPALLEVREFIEDESGPLGRQPLAESIQEVEQEALGIVIEP